VPKSGLAQRFAGSMAAGSIGILPDGPLFWWWGEDGSVWTTHNGALQVLDWRHGPLRLRTVGTIPAMYHIIDSLDNRGTADTYRSSAESLKPSSPYDGEASIGAAVWGDGRLVAIAETRSAWPRQMAAVLKSAIRKYPRLQRERRVLTLYRDRRQAGRYSIPINLEANLLTKTPTGGIVLRSSGRGFRPGLFTLTVRRPMAREHLAFTKDGTRLAWVVETAKGKTIRVFKVQK